MKETLEMRRSNNFRAPTCVLIVASMLVTIAPAAAQDTAAARPIAVPDLNLPIGYDWASRVNSTHLLTDATPLHSFVDAADVKTPYIDLEITGLMPWRPYSLELAHLRHAVYTDGEGKGVAWNVIGESGMWTLLDRRSGEPVTFVTIEGPLVDAPDEEGIPMGGAVVACRPFCPARYKPPQPVDNATADGFAIEQALYSFTNDVRIKASSCHDRTVTVSGKVSGGIAAQAEGGVSRTHKGEVCGDIGAPPGRSTVISRKHAMVKETYEDGSYAIRSRGESRTLRYEEFESPPPWQPGEGAWRYMMTGLTEPREVLRLSEIDAGSVHYEQGMKVFGTSIGVTFKAEGGTQDANWIGFEIQPGLPGVYVLDWITGDYGSRPTRGMVGMAWKES